MSIGRRRINLDDEDDAGGIEKRDKKIVERRMEVKEG